MEAKEVDDAKSPVFGFVFHHMVTESGKTIREENLEKVHNIALGQVVELDVDVEESPMRIYRLGSDKKEVLIGFTGTLRLVVVGHLRDCDGTPLYGLADQPVLLPESKSVVDNMKHRRFMNYVSCGHSEESLTVVDGEILQVERFEDYMQKMNDGLFVM